MADTVNDHKPYIDRHVAEVAYPDGAAGLAVAVGGKVVSVDLFDAPETCRKVWPRVVSGMALDALEERARGPRRRSKCRPRSTPSGRSRGGRRRPRGAGEEERSESDRWHGSVLALNGTLVHGSLIAV